jgi:hypothetical protein
MQIEQKQKLLQEIKEKHEAASASLSQLILTLNNLYYFSYMNNKKLEELCQN